MFRHLTNPGDIRKIRTHPLQSSLILALLGIALSVVLQALHVRAYLQPDASSFCAITPTFDCSRVALNPYSVFLGVPVPLWGALGFVTILVAAWLRSVWLRPLAVLAVLASLVLLGVEILWVKSVCLLCEAVHATALALGFTVWRAGSEWIVPQDAKGALFSIFALPVGTLVAFLAFAPRYFELFNWKTDVTLPNGKTEQGYHWLGAVTPQLTVEEFTDYSCPFCQVAAQHLLKQVIRKPRALRIVRRQFPRTHCVDGFICQPLRLAYCADEQGKFWQADRWLFAHASGKVRVEIETAARDISLDLAKLRSCLVRPEVLARAARESDEALNLGYGGTPTYVVSGKVVSGKELEALLAAL